MTCLFIYVSVINSDLSTVLQIKRSIKALSRIIYQARTQIFLRGMEGGGGGGGLREGGKDAKEKEGEKKD
mgnify:CR=1 FL=1